MAIEDKYYSLENNILTIGGLASVSGSSHPRQLPETPEQTQQVLKRKIRNKPHLL
jgi:hypothetical protein